jgi:hypothetical protein
LWPTWHDSSGASRPPACGASAPASPAAATEQPLVSHSGRRNEQRHHCCYLVAVRVEKYTACFDAIATGPPCFLQPQQHQSLGLRAAWGVRYSSPAARCTRRGRHGNRNLIVALDGFGDGVMDHKPHVRLVDPHSKCCGKPCRTFALRVIRFGPEHTTVSAAHLRSGPCCHSSERSAVDKALVAIRKIDPSAG